MTNSLSITHIMRNIIHKTIVNRNGVPPTCKICGNEIKVGDEYARKNTRSHKYGSFYCIEHAKEKNII